MSDLLLLAIGVAMLGVLGLLAGSLAREDQRTRARWDARFEIEARQTRRTDATGVLRCRSCGASGSERAGVCPRCWARL